MKLSLSRRVNESYLEEVTSIFYYNPKQATLIDRIVCLVDRYGEPRISVVEGCIEMKLEKEKGSFGLFVSKGPKLVAVAVCVERDSGIEIVHMTTNTKIRSKKFVRVLPALIIEQLSASDGCRVSFGYL
ncbi:MAG: hypothetical protein AB7F23_07890 [Phycisphaerae bacterium]